MSKHKGWYVIITQIEIEAIKDPTLLLIYVAIKSYCKNGKREFDISTRDICLRSHLSLGAVTSNLPRLIQNNFVEVVGEKARRGGKVNVYKCILAERLNSESVHNNTESVQVSASNLPQIKKVNKKEKTFEIETTSSKEFEKESLQKIFAALEGK